MVFHFSSDGTLRDGRPLPCLRYAVQSAKNSALYKHPNNIVHRELAKKKTALLNAYDTAADAEDEQEAPDAISGAGGDVAGVAAGDAAPDAIAGAGRDAADGGSYYMEQGDQYFEVDFRRCKVPLLREQSAFREWPRGTQLRQGCQHI